MYSVKKGATKNAYECTRLELRNERHRASCVQELEGVDEDIHTDEVLRQGATVAPSAVEPDPTSLVSALEFPAAPSAVPITPPSAKPQ